MPAYAKVSLVTPVFHPSDVAFARCWAEAAPGLGGWTLVLDKEGAPELVSVIPPGSREPVYFVTRHGGATVLEQKQADGEFAEVGRFEGLRQAVQAICLISDEAVQEIQEALEAAFPRADHR